MPSFQHEVLLQLFRNRPLLAPTLLRDALHQRLPEFTEARLDSAELTDIQPAEYRADLVVLLLHGRAVLGIVVEAQLTRDDAKHYAWPAYVANLRARIKAPVLLLVIAPDQHVARWAATPIEMGSGWRFIPHVLSPTAVPQVIDPLIAQQDPEIAVFRPWCMAGAPTSTLPSKLPSLPLTPAPGSTLIDHRCMLTWS